jgi:hypothetical protein
MTSHRPQPRPTRLQLSDLRRPWALLRRHLRPSGLFGHDAQALGASPLPKTVEASVSMEDPMTRRALRRAFSLGAPLCLLGTLGLSACFEAPTERPQTKVAQETPVRVEQTVKNQVDLLFMIDDSGSMQPKITELRSRFPQLIRLLEDFKTQGSPASYHIGVITSDVGSGRFPLTGCTSGRGGKLQAVGAGAAAGCAPPSGSNFVKYDQIMNTSNLPSGTANSMELEQTFTCMASTGDKGCGFEQQLEAVYRALHDDIPENRGFLRDNALLVVVYLTDEDDCSIDQNSDIFDPAKVTDYGLLSSFRCARFGVAYDGPNGPTLLPYGDSGGAVTNPRPATAAEGARLQEVQKYIDFFKKPKAQGGVKPNPEDVILVGITGPTTPVSTIIANPGSTGPYQTCSAPASGFNNSCAPVLQRSCTTGQFFGDPAVRINYVIENSVPASRRQTTSVCNDSYQSALEGLGALIISNIGPGCITSPLEDPSKPNCVVNDVLTIPNGDKQVTVIPNCAEAAGAKPCWDLNQDTKCQKQCVNAGDPGQQYGVKVTRSQDPPSGTFVQVYCETIAIPPRDSGDPTNPLGCM